MIQEEARKKMANACIFCRIVAGELPCAKVYEDDATLAFMDINPVSKGHTLVVPKTHHDPLTAVPPEVLKQTIMTVQKIAAAQYIGLKAVAINLTQANGELAGQCVPHVHFHLIPRYTGDSQHHWTHGKYDTPAEMQQYATRISNAIADGANGR
jgi:histidine triad (HIT) family protein